jgi:hypothetical protein
MPARLPNWNTSPEFGGTSSGVNGSVTLAAVDSKAAGGMRYRPAGYSIASRRPPTLVLRSHVVSVLLRSQSTNLLREVPGADTSSVIQFLSSRS